MMIFLKIIQIQGIFKQSTDLFSKVFECLTDFSRKNNIGLSSLSYVESAMTTNIINNIGDYSELWYPLFLDLLFDQVKSIRLIVSSKYF